MMRTVLAFLFGLVTGVAAIYVLDGPLNVDLIRREAGEVVQKAGEGARELRLESTVRAALALQRDFSLLGGIAVAADADGNVVLEGRVTSEEQRQLAELIARGVEGVESVDNRLQVVGPEDPGGR